MSPLSIECGMLSGDRLRAESSNESSDEDKKSQFGPGPAPPVRAKPSRTKKKSHLVKVKFMFYEAHVCGGQGRKVAFYFKRKQLSMFFFVYTFQNHQPSRSLADL